MVTLANGSQTVAKGIGSACPLPSLPHTSILYVLDFPFNLISIHKLTRDLNCLITFSDNFVALQDTSMGRTIDIGRESHGASFFSALLIHSHLGHLNIFKFRIMVPRFSSLSLIECESCQLGKHTRVPFTKCLNERTKSHFELVHIDV